MRRLRVEDDYMHPVGSASNWNESRYVDFFDLKAGVGGWFRIGMRPNEGHCEVSTCVWLPGGRVAFAFSRAPVDGNHLVAGGQEWHIGDPYRSVKVAYRGPISYFEDPWVLQDPKAAFTGAPKLDAAIELDVRTVGLEAVMGSDQEHIDRLFLPGQADWHYQHLNWVTGTIRLGEDTYQVSGPGGKDHSWGVRNWLAKIYLRWLIAATVDDRLGFMLVRAVGPTKSTRSGHVWEDGQFYLVDDFKMNNTYSASAPYQVRRLEVAIRCDEREWTAVGTPDNFIPLRHNSPDENGEPALLRMVKSPIRWTFGDGRVAAGTAEIQDRIGADGIPAGHHD
jgi:hypothetical protein